MSIKKICIIKSRRYPLTADEIVDGGSLNVSKIVGALRAKKYEVDVFTRAEDGDSKIIEGNFLRVFPIPFHRSQKAHPMEHDYEEGCSFIEGVIRCPQFNPNRYHCVHTHHWTAGIFLSLYLPKTCRLFHTPHLLAFEKAYYNGLLCPRNVELAERALIDRANAVFALSNTEADTLRCKYGVQAEKVIVSPNGVSPSFFAIPPIRFSRYQRLSLLCIGRTCRQKGIDILLDAVTYLLRDRIPIEVRLVGGPYGEPDYEQSITERIKSPLLRDKVYSIGQVPHSAIPSILNECTIYVQPSRYESQGVALLEAMAAGRVVVASDLPAVQEYLSHGNNGLLFKSGNVESLAETLLYIYLNPADVKGLPYSARMSARSFTWDRMLQRTLTVLTRGVPK